MPTLTFISAFEVRPDADEAFSAGWDRARDHLAASDVTASSALHRALRADVALRFVHIARVTSTDAFPGIALPFTAHQAVYDLVHEDGEPEGSGGTILITPFEVPADEDERFLTSWERLHELFSARQGYLGTRLHRSLAPADFRFVDIVRWSSPLMYARTLKQPDCERAAAAMPYRGRPALYLIAS